VREALFNVLGDISGANVLDLFAGSGALGIEALSRGARQVTFVESARPALEALRENLTQLGVESPEALIVTLPVGRAAKALAARGPFDLVVADPPWPAVNKAAQELGLALRHQLAPEALVVFGHRAGAEPDLPTELGLQVTERRAWGDSAMSFFTAEMRD
jgi:16S rRNA (guanine(966)-N(2))-methyltransferase RsmD